MAQKGQLVQVWRPDKEDELQRHRVGTGILMWDDVPPEFEANDGIEFISTQSIVEVTVSAVSS